MGKLIVFEGTDGCGKSVLSKSIAEKLKAYWTFEPYGSPHDHEHSLNKVCWVLRQLTLDKRYACMTSDARELLLLANRSIHHQLIKEKIKDTHVVCDRSWISGIIYKTFSSPKSSRLTNHLLICITQNCIKG